METVDVAQQSLHLAQSESQLNAEIVKGQDAAFFEPTFVMSTSEGYVDIGFQNTGKVLAHALSAALVITRKTVPGYQNIGPSQTVRIERSEIPPIKPSAGQTVALQGYSQEDRVRIGQMLEIVSIEGSFQYNNGMGDLVKQPVCLIYVELHNPHGGGSRVYALRRCQECSPSDL